MSVRVIRPEDWREADFVEVESSAPDNTHAVIEIENWADAHGFLRTRESLLAKVITEGGKAFRAICYRPTREEVQTVRAQIEAGDEALRRQAAV